MYQDRSNVFDFTGLITAEMANNHQGSVEHGKRIIDMVARAAAESGERIAIKFQFRNLDTFVRPDMRGDMSVPYIKRFEETRLTVEEFSEMIAYAKGQELLTMATPFDNESLNLFSYLDVDILKIASCSADDWPLLRDAVQMGKPIIASTGGLTVDEIDELVRHLDTSGLPFAIMHCVAEYPTPAENLQLAQIERLVTRYPGVPIGFCTHEDPSNQDAVKMAYALGARLFERHVGVPDASQGISLNAYSSDEEAFNVWLLALDRARQSYGSLSRQVSETERAKLRTLKRAVFLKTAVTAGTMLTSDHVALHFPPSDGQVLASEWRDGLVADRDYEAGDPLSVAVLPSDSTHDELVRRYGNRTRAMLNRAGIVLDGDCELELSHHRGIKRFGEVGCVIVTLVNRTYACKLIIQFEGQDHPIHHHRLKDETFIVRWGEVTVTRDGKQHHLVQGDKLVINPGVRHGFRTGTGVIFEEVSTTHMNDDSIYDDPAIAAMKRSDRKSTLSHWR